MKQAHAPHTHAGAPPALVQGRFMPFLLGFMAFLMAGLGVAHAYTNEV